MRPPWDPGSQGSGDLEALQTDVMRFVAILGLCLAAIFSLVNGARFAQPKVPGPAAGESEDVATGSADAGIPAGISQVPAEQTDREFPRTDHRPAGSTPEAASGFTLEFESAEAMNRLVAARRIRVFAIVKGHFWGYNEGGVFRQVDAPPSFYRMDPGTVPRKMRVLASGLGGSDPPEWGVTLPGSTSTGIRQLIAQKSGGSLVIGPDGGVRLEPADR
jgi:hypothetical protein